MSGCLGADLDRKRGSSFLSARAVLLTAAPLMFLCIPPDCYAQARISVYNSLEPITFDGLLTEPCWQKAQAISDFLQRDPHEGEPATEKTEIRVVLYQKTLYFGVVAWDSNPDLIVAKELRRDGAVEADDSMTIVLDTYLDHRNAFYFAFNANGARRDGLLVDEGMVISAKGGTKVDQLNADWNGNWDVKAVVTDKGWQAEVMIPLDTLRSKSNQQVWGINFRRTICRKNEEVLWQAWRRNLGIFRVSEAGLLDGLPNFQQAHRYEIRPFVSVAETETLPPGASPTSDLVSEHLVKFGADGKAKLSENLTADLTVNTDFAQTEVDQAVVNLKRFPILFPEKRDFFLENAGFFDFVQPAGNKVFFSRRIGLSPTGDPIPIDFGSKVTGKIGRLDLGFLDVKTREQGSDLPDTNFTTFRPKYGLLKQSYVGAIFTDVYNTRDGNRNQVYGFDGAFRFTNLFRQNLSVSSSIALSSTKGLKGDNASGYFGVAFPNDWLDAFFNYGFVQKNFNPELGFMQRGSVEQYSARWRFQPRPPAPWNKWIRKLYFKPLDMDLYKTLPTRQLESLRLEFRPIGADFQTGDKMEFNIQRAFDRLDQSFNIFRSVVIPKGRYWWTIYEIQFGTSPKRRWDLTKVNFQWGHYYNGEMKTFTIDGDFKFTSHFSLGGGYGINYATQFQGASFTTHAVTSRVVYALSNRANLQVFTQWNNDNRTVNVYVRLHIIPKIGSDIYAVFNQLIDTSGLRRTNMGRAIRGKFVPGFLF